MYHLFYINYVLCIEYFVGITLFTCDDISIIWILLFLLCCR